MSSSFNITGLLAQLINGTTEQKPPSTSVRNLQKVSLTTAHYNSKFQSGNSRTSPQANPTKKAIVLKHIEGTPVVNSSAGSDTDWFKTMKDFLPNYGVSENTADTISATGITNYPKYRVWILPDNISSFSAVPIVEDGQITNLGRFPICSIKDAAMTEKLVDGALIRVDFENRLLGSDAYATNIMNNGKEFGTAIFKELSGIASPEGSFAPCNEQGIAVRHPSGDVVGAGADLLPVSAITPFGLRHGNKNEPTNWTGIEIHYTVTQNAADAISVLGNRGLSYHYLISKDGTQTTLIDSDYIAWHGGNDNSRFIGISLVNLGNDIASINLPDATPAEEWVKLASGQYGTWEPYTTAQENTLVALVSELKTKYPTIEYINGHEDNAEQKNDPGPMFNWNLPFGLTRGPNPASTKNS
tara:strand:- start:309 stop:1550 length:1242 start_codon:yes stop_codon:yes gene_type:complete